MASQVDAAPTTGLLSEVLASTPLPVKKPRTAKVDGVKKPKDATNGVKKPRAPTVATDDSSKVDGGVTKAKKAPVKKALAFFLKDSSGLGIFKDEILALLKAA